jgi:hypothetical protein
MPRQKEPLAIAAEADASSFGINKSWRRDMSVRLSVCLIAMMQDI